MTADPVGLRRKARQLYEARRERDRLLGDYATLMGEPVWDLLLRLFILDEPRAGEHFDDPPPEPARLTPEIHWILVLQRLGLIERRAEPEQERRSIRLSRAGVELLARVLVHA